MIGAVAALVKWTRRVSGATALTKAFMVREIRVSYAVCCLLEIERIVKGQSREK